MMSAKTVLTDAPMCPPPAAPNNAATAPPPGGAPSDFQNVLAGAVLPVVEPSLNDTQPQLQPLVQLLDLKQQQQKLANQAGGTPVPVAGKAARPSAVSPVDLLKILNDNAALLPGAAEAAADGVADDVREGDEPVKVDDDALAEWLDMMLPPSVFAPQAGATNTGAANSSQDGAVGLRNGVALAALPASLVLQAGLPDTNDAMETGTPVPQGIPLTINREAAAAAAQSSAAAFTAALAPKTEATDPDAPTTDSWMNAMGDLSSKRTADMAPAAESRLSTPVHDARWADALAHRLVLMARDGESVASLKLVPVDLGPLDIQIRVRDGEASVHFGAAHQETRAALEASMPRLRELLSAQGLQLANASVSHQSAGQNRPERSSSGGAIGAIADDGEVTAKVISTSLLDIYA
jgi:flagellar hook-length control protein FliK